jgi:radical SAM protein with 4Fe4S-binding SPASM domain
MRSLGYPPSPVWDLDTDLLSAPTEVHASVTRRCSVGCTGCYVDSYLPGTRPELEASELGLQGMKRVVDILAEHRVFHMALGGGESLELPWLFDLAEYARAKGIIPNLTTNGFPLEPRMARRCRVFGQINVSIDGLGEGYREARGVDGFEKADRALTLLRKAGCRAGINTVVSRHNFDRLGEIVRYARRKKAGQIELLRFKPAGRGADRFGEMDLTPEQSASFFPLVTSLLRKTRIRLRLDCSLMPMVYAHEPDPNRLDRFAMLGCHGGQILMGVGPDGAVSACSFAPAEEWNLLDMRGWWRDPRAFAPFRLWQESAPEPCGSCRYLELCRGGCHAVALAVHGTMSRPDPGCPIVQRYEGRGA